MAGLDGNRLILKAVDPNVVGGFTLTASTNDPAVKDLGFSASQAARRLSCLRFDDPRPAEGGSPVARFGPDGAGPPSRRLNCACAPVHDYTGREVARVGLFGHGGDEDALVGRFGRDAREIARLVSLRLGYLPSAALAVSA